MNISLGFMFEVENNSSKKSNKVKDWRDGSETRTKYGPFRGTDFESQNPGELANYSLYSNKGVV